ncbi:UNVERIFIED_CONTAM: hypothetical protein Sradi_6448600 [Sesamum radiatum]|uniref:Uncharacterized protein n=1 Tax=Sesamum radiatum TaxID=300843 RepID=A0AAW2K762_SESRA
MPSRKVLHFFEEVNAKLLKKYLYPVEKFYEKAFIRTQRHKSTMINVYNRRVKARYFQVGDLVLRRVDTLNPVGKMDHNWEGPYKVTRIIGKAAYELEDEEGLSLSKSLEHTQSKEVLHMTKDFPQIAIMSSTKDIPYVTIMFSTKDV